MCIDVRFLLCGIALLTGLATVAAPYPPYYDGGGGSAVHFAPVAWPDEADWVPYTLQGWTANDDRDSDPSNGGTSPRNYVNVTSGCSDKVEPSVYSAFDPVNEVIFYRWRVQQRANTFATGPRPGAFSSTDPWNSALWSVLIDIDGDGFREFTVMLDGSSGTSGTEIDRLVVYYSDTPVQYPDSPEIGHNPSAFVDGNAGTTTDTLLNFQGSLAPTSSWPNGADETDWDYGTTRFLEVAGTTCDEHWVMYQIPLAMLDATAQGGPKVTSSTPFAMLFATSNSLNNPLQKDVIFDGEFVADPTLPAPFGDTIKLDGGICQSPLVETVAAAGCGPVSLSATVRDSLMAVNGVMVTSITAVTFHYYLDADGNGLADDGNSWALAGAASSTNTLGQWVLDWDSTGLERGQYLIGVQAVDNIAENQSGVAHRTFSYLSANDVSLLTAPAGEEYFANPDPEPGVVFTTLNNSCGTPPPSISKTVTPSFQVAGGTVDLEITVTNPTGSPVTIDSITDLLPPGFSVNNPPVSGGTIDTPTTEPANGATGAVVWTFAPPATIPAGLSETLTFQATVSMVPGTYSNNLSASGSTGQIVGEPVPIGVGQPRPTITKFSDVSTASPGDTVTYTLLFSNDSPMNLTGVVITDTVPDGATYVPGSMTLESNSLSDAVDGDSGSYTGGTETLTWSIGFLPSGEGPYSATFQVTIDDPYPDSAPIPMANTAVIDSNESGPESAEDTLWIESPRANFAIQKDGDVKINEGNQASYLITYQNIGESTGTNVVITDTIPPGFTFISASGGGTHDGNSPGIVTWTIGSVVAGGAGSFTLTLQADSPFLAANPATNVASIDSDQTNPTDDTFKTAVIRSDQLCMVPVVFTDTSDGDADIAKVAADDATTGSDPTFRDSYDAPQDSIDLTIYQEFTFPNNQIAPTDVISGTIISAFNYYEKNLNNAEIHVFAGTNAGTTADDVIVLDPSVSQNKEITEVIDLYALGYDTPSEVNGIRVRFLGSSPQASVAARRQEIDFIEVCVTIAEPPDLIVDKQSDSFQLSAGDPIQYSIYFANLGGVKTTGTTIADDLPAGLSYVDATLNGIAVAPDSVVGSTYTYTVNSSDTSTPGVVTAGNSGTLVVNAIANSPLEETVFTFTNVATIDSNETTPEFDDTTSFAVRPEISLSKSASPTLLKPGDTVTFTIEALNFGRAPATNVDITDVIPAENYFEYVAGSISGGDSRDATGAPTLTWRVNSLSPGATASVSFQMKVRDTAPLPPSGVTTKTNFATEDNDTIDGTRQSNDAVVSITTNPILTIDKTVISTAPFAPGDSVEYSIVVSNDGFGDAEGVRIVDAIPVGSSFSPGSLLVDTVSKTDIDDADNARFDPVTGRVLFDIATLAAFDSVDVRFTVVLDSVFAAGDTVVPNTASVSATNAPPKEDSEDITVTAQPDLQLIKSGPDSLAYPVTTLDQDAAATTTITVVDSSRFSFGQALRVNGTDTTVSAIAANVLTLADPVTGTAGDPVFGGMTYTLSYSNLGNADATGATLVDTLPNEVIHIASTGGGVYAAGPHTVSWTIGTLAAGESGNFQVNVMPISPGQAINGAVLDSNETGPVDDDIETSIGGLQIRKETTTPVVISLPTGSQANYIITIENTRSTPFTDVDVTDTVIPGFSYGSTTSVTFSSTGNGPTGFPTAGDNPMTWSGLNIAANETVTITFIADIAWGTGEGIHQNLVSATHNGGDSSGVIPFDELSTEDEDVEIIVPTPPVITGTQQITGLDDKYATDTKPSSALPFSTVVISDPDEAPVSTVLTVTITLDDCDKGYLAVGATGFAETPANSGIYIGTFADPTAATTAINALIYYPYENHVHPTNFVTANFNIQIEDGIFTTTDNTTSVEVESINDAPQILNTLAGQTVQDDEFLRPFLSTTIDDVDNADGLFCSNSITPAQLLGVTVVLDDCDKGELQHRVSMPGALAADDIDLWPDQPSALYDGLAVRFVNTLSDGTALATYNSAAREVVVNITSGVTCAYAVVDAINALADFSASTNNLTDASPNLGNDVVFAGSTAPATFSHLTKVSCSVYVANGHTRESARDLLRSLTFEPTENRVPPGSTETTSFTITVSDGMETVVDDITTVISHSQNNPPTVPEKCLTVSEDAVNGTNITSLNGIDFITQFIGSDIDPGHTEALTYSLRSPGGGSGSGIFSISASGRITVADTSQLDFETNTLFKLEVVAEDPLGATNASLSHQKLSPCDPDLDDYFGSAVAVDGDYIAIGAKYADVNGSNDSGAVYIFERSGTAWTNVARIVPSDVIADGFFGAALALSGDRLLVGAPGQDHAFLFQRTGGLWSQVAGPISGVDTAGGDNFGVSVDISGTDYVIGAPLHDGVGIDSGAAYLFGAVTSKLEPNDLQPGDLAGSSVAIDGTSVIIGSPQEDAAAIDSGSAYVFVNGVQQAKLTTTDGVNSDLFGAAVDIAGDTVVVGAPLQDAYEFAGGAVYLFKRTGTAWVLQNKVAPTDIAVADNFGSSVSITDDRSQITFAAGSPFDDDNGANDSGSVYTFEQEVGTTNWVQLTKETLETPGAGDKFGVDIDLDVDELVVGASLADPIRNGGAINNAGCAAIIDIDPGEICIIVVNANDPPVINDASMSVCENTVAGQAIGTPFSSDPDAGDTLSYFIDAGNTSGHFLITAGGTLETTGVPIDFEASSSFTLSLRVVDDGTPSLSDIATVVISICDLNEAPVLDDSTHKVDENLANGTLIRTLSPNDPDTGDTFLFTLLGGNAAGGFALDSSTGALTVADNTILDYEQTTTFTLVVRVDDSGTPSESDVATVTVNLCDVNEPPVCGGTTSFTVNEDAPGGTLVGPLGTTDPDNAQTINHLITAGDAANAFSIDGSGNLVVNDSSGFENTTTYVITIDASDDGTPPLTTVCPVTVNVISGNDCPQVTIPAGPLSIDEGNQVTFTATATDPDLPGDTLTFSLGASSIALGASITSGGLFSWTPSEAQGPGTFTISVCVTDGSCQVCQQVTINVAEDNEPPAISCNGNNSINEGQLLSYTVSASDNDIPAQVITYSLNDPSNTGATLDSNSGAFSWTPNATQGSIGGTLYTMSFCATDSGGQTTCTQCTITVYEIVQGTCNPASWQNVYGLDLGPGSDVTRRVLDEPGENRTFQAGAISTTSILGDDGFVQTTVDETNTNRMFGLSDSIDASQHFSDILYAFFLDSNGMLSIYESGGQAEAFVAIPYYSGDELRIEVASGSVNYIQNNATVYTSARPVTLDDYPLKFDMSLQSDGATLRSNCISPEVPASPRVLCVTADDHDHTDNQFGNGDTLTIEFDKMTNSPGGGGVQNRGAVDNMFTFTEALGQDYQGSWVSSTAFVITIVNSTGHGPVEIDVSSVIPNFSTSPILDLSGTSAPSSNRSLPMCGDFGTTLPNTDPVCWQNLVDATTGPNPNDLSTSSGNDTGFGGAVSCDPIEYGDFCVSFVPDQTDAEVVIGVTSLLANSDASPSDMIFAIVCQPGGHFGVQYGESRTRFCGIGTYTSKDILELCIEDDQVHFYINGVLVFTAPVQIDPSAFPLAVDSSLGTGGASNVRISDDASTDAPPRLLSVTANDPDDGDRKLSAGDTVTFTLDRATNTPAGSFDDLFIASDLIATNFSGGWISATQYQVTITDPAGSDLILDETGFAIAGVVPITTASGASSGGNPALGVVYLGGDWGQVGLTAGNVVWENLTNAVDSGSGTLTKTSATNAWDAFGDSSASFLFGPAYTELAVATVDQAYLFGFSPTGNRPHPNTAACALKVDANNALYVVEGSTQVGTFGTVRVGDVLRVDIDASGGVTYLRNDTVLFTSSKTATFPCEVVGSIFSSTGTIDGLVRSAPPVAFPPVITTFEADDPDNSEDAYASGDTLSIKLDIATDEAGGNSIQNKAAVDDLFTFSVNLGLNYSGRWETASCFRVTILNASNNGSPTIGDLTVSPTGTTPILDAAGVSPASSSASPVLTGDFGDVRAPGSSAVWTELYRATTDPDQANTLCKVSTVVSQPAGAVTTQQIAANTRGEAFIEADALVDNRSRMIGFTDAEAVTELSHLAYGAMLDQSGNFMIYESGVLIGTFGQYSAGSLVRVAMLSDQTVAYYVDGALRYLSAKVIRPEFDLPMRGAAYLQSEGSKITNARVSIPPAIVGFSQAILGTGYTLTIEMSQPTDAPAGSVDDLWSFSDTIGAVYNGAWASNSLYRITVSDIAGANLQSGTSTVSPAGTPPIYQASPGALSPAVNGVSPPLVGAFDNGDFGRYIFWDNVTNATVGADATLTKTGASAQNTSGARSRISLTSGEAFFTFQVNSLEHTYAIGWASSDPDQSLNSIDFAFHVDGNSGGLAIMEFGATIMSGFAPLAIGEILRLEIIGGSVAYRRGDTLLYTSTQTADQFPYNVDASLISEGASAYNVRVSLPPVQQPRITSFTVIDPDDGNSSYDAGDVFTVTFDQDTNMPPNGNALTLAKADVDNLFNLKHLNGPGLFGTDYSGRWIAANIFSVTTNDTSGSSGIILDEVQIIPSGVTEIRDAAATDGSASDNPSPFLRGSFGLRNKIVWEAARGVSVAAEDLQKVSSDTVAGDWSSGAQSSLFLTTGFAFLETRVAETTTYRMIGWTSLPALSPGDNHHFTTIEWGALLSATGEFKAWRRPGRFVENLGTYRVNDVIRIEVDPVAPAVRWKVNGVTRYSFVPEVDSETSIRYPLRVRASFDTRLATVTDVTTNIAVPPIPTIIGYASTGDGNGTPDAGETFTISFSQPTNTPIDDTVVLETTDINSLFIFNGSLGAAYSGVWDNPTSFTITVIDAAGATAQVGRATVTARGGPFPGELVIRNASGTSNPVFGTSPSLAGTARSSGGTTISSHAPVEADVLVLSEGWNLVGLSLEPIHAAADAFFGDTAISDVFSAQGEANTPAPELQTGVGYWLYNPGPAREVVFLGTRGSGTRQLPAGWSTVSVPNAAAIPAGASAYRYEDGVYTTSDVLEPGVGYWLHVPSPTILAW